MYRGSLFLLTLALSVFIINATCKFGDSGYQCLEETDIIKYKNGGIECLPLENDFAQYNVSLFMQNNQYNEYAISIFPYNVPKENCNTAVLKDTHHNARGKKLYEFTIKTEPVDCSQVQLSFCLAYLASDCYLITTEPRVKTNSHRLVQHTLLTLNKFVPQDFHLHVPNFVFENKELVIEATWQFEPMDFSDFRYDVFISGNDFPIKNVSKDCIFTQNRVICSIGDLPHGNYSMQFRLIDEWRCNDDNCLWKGSIERHVSPKGLPQVVSMYSYEWNGSILTALIIFAMCAASLLLLMFYKKRRRINHFQNMFDNHLCNGSECNIRDQDKIDGIFLLYARDCQPFMDVMTNFRILLNSMTGCKIYDMFDDSLFNEIALSPNEWVQRLIQNPQIKVIIVATECADLLYKSLLRYYSHPTKNEKNLPVHVQHYNSPNYMDNLIIHALKMISFDITPAPYHKFFVIRFPKFNKCDDYLSHINPFKRFDMYENLEILVETVLEHSKGVRIEEWSNVQLEKSLYANYNRHAFVEAVDSLYLYYKANPSYLMSDFLNNEVISNNTV